MTKFGAAVGGEADPCSGACARGPPLTYCFIQRTVTFIAYVRDFFRLSEEGWREGGGRKGGLGVEHAHPPPRKPPPHFPQINLTVFGIY